jgi:hypothetical protein
MWAAAACGQRIRLLAGKGFALMKGNGYNVIEDEQKGGIDKHLLKAP